MGAEQSSQLQEEVERMKEQVGDNPNDIAATERRFKAREERQQERLHRINLYSDKKEKIKEKINTSSDLRMELYKKKIIVPQVLID